MGFEDTFRSLKVKGDLVVGGTLTAPGFSGGGSGTSGYSGYSGYSGISGYSGAAAALQVFAKGTFNTLGGDVTETITGLTGVTGTDVVMVMVKTAGASPTYVKAAAAGTAQIVVTMAADPSTDHVLEYAVFR